MVVVVEDADDVVVVVIVLNVVVIGKPLIIQGISQQVLEETPGQYSAIVSRRYYCRILQ